MTELDDLIRGSLTTFAHEVLAGVWQGRREREAVSLYAFGYLIRYVRAGSSLHHPAQIGIEFPVPQLPASITTSLSGRADSKNQVCKDLVIWPQPGMACWDEHGEATVAPSVILEWKFGIAKIEMRDVKWLTAYSERYPGFIGYAVTANRPGADFLLRCARVADGKQDLDWLFV